MHFFRGHLDPADDASFRELVLRHQARIRSLGDDAAAEDIADGWAPDPSTADARLTLEAIPGG